eukprot:CAMPEP_0177792898 /NCGR_PEP_ID=MMETSP0491_2-20121128/24770_1 /TAXON_ID=63592 /ORGANISM="Tetraselmis chuii, Strain PLY429" /LENGTH=148 /DNA_ID=CAMNT_0019315343 /DNA_START=405 /DNA_END=848 /DNA_ORIENTATION=+
MSSTPFASSSPSSTFCIQLGATPIFTRKFPEVGSPIASTSAENVPTSSGSLESVIFFGSPCPGDDEGLAWLAPATTTAAAAWLGLISCASGWRIATHSHRAAPPPSHGNRPSAVDRDGARAAAEKPDAVCIATAPALSVMAAVREHSG